MGRGAYLAATRGGTDRAAARAFSDRAQRSYSSQNNNQTGQSSSGSQENKKTNNERATDRLVELHNQGQGDSTQAQDIKWRLAQSDAKADAWNYAQNRPASFDEKMGALLGYTQNQRDLSGGSGPGYQTSAFGAEGYLADFAKKQAQSVYDADQEGQFFKDLESNVNVKGLNLAQYGIKSFADLKKQIEMQPGEYTTIMQDIIDSPEFKKMGAQQQYAALQTLEGVVAGGSLSGAGALYQITDQERADMGLPLDSDTMQSFYSTYVDPQQQAYDPSGFITTQGKYGIPAYKGRDDAGNLIKSMNPFANTYRPSSYYSASPSYGGGYSSPNYNYGGGGGYGGYGGGGGDSGGGVGGYAFNEYAQQGIQQAPGVNPGNLQETVSQGFLQGMGAPRFSRGGIVSLLRLGE